MRRDSSETKRKILTVCVRLFLEQGYKNTSVSQIVDEAGVARGSYLNLFPTKDKILLDLTETMFGGQFGMARSITDTKLPPVYAYALETAIQLTLTELNENLREIYIEAYSLPETSEYIYLHTTAELKQIFSANFPDYSDSDFYEMEIGTAGLMRSYMARKCDIHFPSGNNDDSGGDHDSSDLPNVQQGTYAEYLFCADISGNRKCILSVHAEAVYGQPAGFSSGSGKAGRSRRYQYLSEGGAAFGVPGYRCSGDFDISWKME